MSAADQINVLLKKKNTTHCHISTHKHNYSPHVGHCHYFLDTCDHNYLLLDYLIVSAARSLTCRDDSKWQLLLAENELSRVSLLSRISNGN